MHVILGPKPQQAQQRRERPASAAAARVGGTAAAASVRDVNDLPSDRAPESEPGDTQPVTSGE
jgi:hypothetical protein